MSNSEMITIFSGTVILGALHALIPNHWLPVLSVSRSENWSLRETMTITFFSALGHALSTVMLGVVIAFAGITATNLLRPFTELIAPTILVVMGTFFILQHYRNSHFHMSGKIFGQNKLGIVLGLVVAMFLSPCLEIEGYFLVAGIHGMPYVFMLSILYTVISVSGMVAWIYFAYKGILLFNWVKLKHNASIITGVTLIGTGIISYFFH